MAIILKNPSGQSVPAQATDDNYLITTEGYARVQEAVYIYQGTAANAIVSTLPARLWGVWVSTATNLTLSFYDGTNSSGALKIGSFAASAATLYPLIQGAIFSTGVYMQAQGTGTFSVGYEPLV